MSLLRWDLAATGETNPAPSNQRCEPEIKAIPSYYPLDNHAFPGWIKFHPMLPISLTPE